MTDSSTGPARGTEELLEALERAQAEILSLRERTRFGLVWEEQPEQAEEMMKSKTPVLTHRKSLGISGKTSQDLHHVLIEGDNLHALTVLQSTHAGRVDLVYIDPPYNTGHEFAYNDKIIDENHRWRHSAWLSFMSKRLELAAELLADDGLIIISIDDHEQARLKLLCDQVFGSSNFLVCAPTIMNLKGNQSEFGFAGTHEYTLVYAKNIELARIGEFAVDEESVLHDWEEDEQGMWKRGAGLKATGEDGARERRPNLWFPLYVARDGEYVSPKRVAATDDEVWPTTGGKQMRWRWSIQAVESKSGDLIAAGSSPDWTIYKKQRPSLGDLPTRKPKSTLYSPAYSSTNGTNTLKRIMGDRVFPNPKPVDLIKDLVAIAATKSDAIVLDFFAGSGTTLHAVAELNAEDGGNRQAILVTNNESGICREVTLPRARAVLTGQWADGETRAPLPGSLSFYTTDFLPNRRNRDQAFLDFAARSADIIAVKEGAEAREVDEEGLTVLRGNERTVAIVTDSFDDHAEFAAAAARIAKEGDLRRAYVFTWSDDGVEAEIVEQWNGWEVRPLPAPLLAAIRRRIGQDSGGMK